MSSLQNAGPAINILPMENAYYCCKCLFGPMLLELYPACIECGAPACGSCKFTSLPELRAQTGAGCSPCDAHGASVLGFDNDPSPMMDRFVREQPTVAERLLAGAGPRSLTGLQDQTDGMVRRLEYVADEYRPRM
ncbi:hypothetical protein BFW01_g8580 [Lasiodiplodia theobromae]|uniref:Uncharacterized protein n=1 Tax=Lasiodiplodia theobromae TaxID=45133 RepID=A0A5N5DK03_9PEZI|nr:Thiamine-monophosphate kinase [Lasiodiplodia theobromae]KAB2577222.1 hypothetical protein DBV05_g4032 [Lasiodiplodia theobromae]KAF4538627.1 Thiamine-monophosphate kinase [Lasiodiplodia theobromae]KAF9637684.1 hypothetical protein BFW01_g8580 [Lasiodiplodia theobromae]